MLRARYENGRATSPYFVPLAAVFLLPTPSPMLFVPRSPTCVFVRLRNHKLSQEVAIFREIATLFGTPLAL